jgi:hypothetical protein
MPHHKIELQNPFTVNPPTDEAGREAAKLWVPKGLMVQWGLFVESDGSPAVGIGVGNFGGDDESTASADGGNGKLEDLCMLWFNRSQVNETIRILRRARTSAYGADE